MSESEIKTVYSCVVCGKAWNNKQSLRSHMKVHKREGYVRTSIVARSQDWKDFQDLCDKHHTTTCRLLGTLIKAALKGAETGVINVGSENPTVIQVNEINLGPSRGRYSHFDGRPLLERLEDPRSKKWPAPCDRQGSWWDSDRSIGCLEKKERVSVRECWICFNNRLSRG